MDMEYNKLSMEIGQMPSTIPVFPLSGVLLLPGVEVPLNIYEPKYINMVDDALSEKRIIGLIQPQQGLFSRLRKNKGLYDIGCAGKIKSFNETEDGRYLIVLSGLSRFTLDEEVSTIRGYRRFKVDWEGFGEDTKYIETSRKFSTDKKLLLDKVDKYLQDHQVEGSFSDIEGFDLINDAFLVDFLCTYLPFLPQEKQLFLEAKTIDERVDVLYKVLGIAEAERRLDSSNGNTLH